MNWLFDDLVFMTRSHCGAGWTDSLITLSQLSDFGIGVSYIGIAIYCIIFYIRYDIPRSYILGLFAAFIIMCGLTHFCQVAVFHKAYYRFYVLMSIITFVVSFVTLLCLPKVHKTLSGYPSLRQMEDLNIALKDEITFRQQLQAETEAMNIRLKEKIALLESEEQWSVDRHRVIDQMKQILDQ